MGRSNGSDALRGSATLS